MPSFKCIIGFLLLISALTIESSYYAYTYDDGAGNDEHCCLVRLGEDFCLAKPLTRSLLQVNKQCQQLDDNEKNKNYLNKIVRRLDVESSKKVGDKILLQLKKSLEKPLLNNDLLCLATADNNINLEKCYVELPAVKQKKSKGKKTNATVDETEANDDDKVKATEIEVTEPVLIRKGRGLSVRQTYELNLTDVKTTSRKQRDCYSWYRKNTKEVLNNPTKSQKTCISLTNQQEKCLEQLFYKKLDGDTEEPYEKNSIKTGSKLYCENNNKQKKLLGTYRSSEICFTTHYQIYIEHKFTDLVSLSDVKKNKDVLQYLSNNTKLTSEFESDCNDKKTLAFIKQQLEEEEKAEANTVDDTATPPPPATTTAAADN